MAQATIQNLDPTTTDGTELAAALNNFAAALRSTNLGATRPPYAETGMLWGQQTSPSVITLFLFDGADDILIGTVNTASNTFMPSGAAAPTLAQLGGVPTTRAINTEHSLTGGGNLSTDRTFKLVGDAASPGNNRYYGTNAGGVRGFYPLPASSGASPVLQEWWTGTHNWTVPAGVTRVHFEVIAAGGGQRVVDWDPPNPPETYLGGWGGRARGTLAVTPGASIQIIVGAPGDANTSLDRNIWSGAGGNSGVPGVVVAGGQGRNGFGAGGATGGLSWDVSLNFSGTTPRLLNQNGTEFGAPGAPGVVVGTYWLPS